MNILAIESSCDETAAAVVADGRTVLSDVVLSQIDMHTLYGGVVPEIASRKHIEAVYGLARRALEEAGLSEQGPDAVAVTYAPGLIGALLVGLNFAKGYALSRGLPLIPVHHHRGHIAANYLAFPELEPPFLALVVSGGHSLLVDVEDYTVMRVVGSTRDDAAGEAFDKVARVLGLGYPGGPKIDKLAQTGDPKRYKLPRAHVEGAELDMSFSGLKTAVLNLNHQAQQKGEALDLPGLAASFTAAVCDTLAPRVELAARQLGRKTVVAAGGVAANTGVRQALKEVCGRNGWKLYTPPLRYCGDGGAMIAAQAWYEYQAGHVADLSLNAYATLDISRERYIPAR